MGAKKVNIISLTLRFIIGSLWISFWSLISISLMIVCLPFRNLRIKLGNFTGKMIGPFITRITGTKIKYSTIATGGDAVDFGDTTVKKYIPAVAASSTRCAIAGGKQQPSPNAMENGIEYVQILSLIHI